MFTDVRILTLRKGHSNVCHPTDNMAKMCFRIFSNIQAQLDFEQILPHQISSIIFQTIFSSFHALTLKNNVLHFLILIKTCWNENIIKPPREHLVNVK